MSDHRRFEELLALRLLGELGHGEERELERHLAVCPQCREEAGALRLVHDELSGASVPTPPHLKDRVMANLPRRRWRVPGSLAAAALLVALLLGGVYAQFFGGTDTLAGEASLSPTELASGASGAVRLEETGSNLRVKLDVFGLPRLRSDEYYELWFVEGDERISGGGFTVDNEGRATVTMNAPSAADEYPAVGITREKSPGDPRPSSTKVLGGDLRRT